MGKKTKTIAQAKVQTVTLTKTKDQAMIKWLCVQQPRTYLFLTHRVRPFID